MAWLGLIAGIVIGGLIWEWNGAIVLGFFGWLAGIIIGSKKQAKAGSAVNAPAPPKPAEAPANRIDRLERTVAALEQRIARLETGQAPIAAPVAEPATAEAVVPVEAPPEPVPEPTMAPAAEPPVPAQPEPIFAPVAARATTSGLPPAPSKPNPIIAWFTGGNAIVRVGVVILFLGLVFLLNWAREHQLIPPELRVAGVAAVGIVPQVRTK